MCFIFNKLILRPYDQLNIVAYVAFFYYLVYYFCVVCYCDGGLFCLSAILTSFAGMPESV